MTAPPGEQQQEVSTALHLRQHGTVAERPFRCSTSMAPSSLGNCIGADANAERRKGHSTSTSAVLTSCRCFSRPQQPPAVPSDAVVHQH
ncbi:hypothetical protein BHE74_00005843 [Ensete ventricosum]|nr:hypothetical protein GW17_00039610 [Ensete ventricosum]RWW85466.1 hypothetical protein BHE74_00005843 [Ensete ventricosum]RZR84076.1 hypothetical protein BHM03_00010803 [Ensete ventricosum]